MATQLSSDAKHVSCGSQTTESTSTKSVIHEKGTMEVKVLLITPERGIDYTILQNNGSLEWKIHRLLWIGYLKNIDNEKCFLSKVPKDVIKYIIKFFITDDSSFSIIKCDEAATFHDIAQYFTQYLKKSTKQFFQRLELKDVNLDMPFVHIWVQFGCIKDIYPLMRKGCVSFGAEYIKNVNLKKWVEIPDDFMPSLRLSDIDFDKYNHICVEFIGIRDKDEKQVSDVYPKSILTPKQQIQSHIFWPLAKPDDEWKDFQVGDIVDVKDNANVWYEAMIRGVRIPEEKRKEIAVHYVGWVVKHDQWIDCTCKHAEIAYKQSSSFVIIEPRIAKRGTNTIGPHRPHNRCHLINQYQKELTQLLAMGFNDTNLNMQALGVADGDVQQSVDIIVSNSSPPDLHNKHGEIARQYHPQPRRQQGLSQFHKNNNHRNLDSYWTRAIDRHRHRHMHGITSRSGYNVNIPNTINNIGHINAIPIIINDSYQRSPFCDNINVNNNSINNKYRHVRNNKNEERVTSSNIVSSIPNFSGIVNPNFASNISFGSPPNLIGHGFAGQSPILVDNNNNNSRSNTASNRRGGYNKNNNNNNNNNRGRNDYGARPPMGASFPTRMTLNSPFAANVANNDPSYSRGVDSSSGDILYPGIFLSRPPRIAGGYGGPPSGRGFAPSAPHGGSSVHSGNTMTDGRWLPHGLVNGSYPRNARSGTQRGYRSTKDRRRRGGSTSNQSGDVHVHVPIHPAQSRLPEAQAYFARRRKTRIRRYLKYYFSATNLAQDEHFCGLMNSRGFVNIDEILKFAQMQRIGASTDDLVKLTIESSDLELSRDQFRIRTKQWRSFTPNPPSPVESGEEESEGSIDPQKEKVTKETIDKIVQKIEAKDKQRKERRRKRRKKREAERKAKEAKEAQAQADGKKGGKEDNKEDGKGDDKGDTAKADANEANASGVKGGKEEEETDVNANVNENAAINDDADNDADNQDKHNSGIDFNAIEKDEDEDEAQNNDYHEDTSVVDVD